MEEMKEQLKEFPSLFDFKKEELIRQNNVRRLIDKHQGDDEATEKSTTQIRNYNFISYLYYLDEKLEEAFKFADKSLAIDPENLGANVIKCHLFLEGGHLMDAEKILQCILELKEKEKFRQEELDAKADLAYAYGSSGPFYHGEAEQIYREIVSECPTNYGWKFGLGLSLVRQTHIANTAKKNVFSHRDEMLVEALDLFLDVAKQTNDIDETTYARAWVQIGVVLYHNEQRKTEYRRIALPKDLRSVSAKSCFIKALEKCPDDPFILVKCGQHLRYFGELENSEKFLRHAKRMLDDCSANYQLALTLQQKVFKNSTNVQYPLKRPRQVQIYPNNPTLQDAEKYLREAAKMSDGATIWYDLALLYRYLGQPQEALATLNKTTGRYQSDVTVINVYEQKAMCYLDIKEQTRDQQERTNCTKSAECYLYKATERQTILVKEKQKFESFPTLKSLLHRNRGNSSSREIHQMMDDFEETINLRKLLQENSSLTGMEHGRLIESCVCKGDFDKASVLLNILQCTDQFIDRSVAVKSSIECALHAVQEDDCLIAASRFRSAYKIARPRKEPEMCYTNAGGCRTEDAYDLHIVRRCTADDVCLDFDQIVALLKKFTDLKVSVIVEDTMESSTFSTDFRENAVVFLHVDPNESDKGVIKDYFDKLRTIGGKVIVITAENTWTFDILDSLNIAVVRLPAKKTDSSGSADTTDEEKGREVTILKRFFEKLCEID